MASCLKYIAAILSVTLTLTSASDTCPTGCTCDPVETLNCRNVDKIPEFNVRHDIDNLIIRDHNITNLTYADLQGFDSLKKIYITEGTLEMVEADAFKDVKDVVVSIMLCGNHIKEIPIGLFKDMPHVSLINITKNKLTEIKEGTFDNLAGLVNLNLEFNAIYTIEEDAVRDVPSLDNVNLFDNKLTVIPVNGIKSATSVRKLDVSFNKIQTIPEDLGTQLDSLEELNLESNPVASFTVFPKISNSLKILNLEFMNIVSIQKSAWKNVPTLEEIYLSGNLYTELHQEMFTGLDNVNTIFLMSNPHLTKVGPYTFSKLDKLTALHLTMNQELSEIGTSAFSSANITHIHLRDNKLSTIKEDLMNWTSVRYFSLDHNPINCDCNLQWIFKPEYNSMRSNFSKVSCAYPSKYTGKGILTIPKSDLTCQTTHKQRLATGIVVAVFCLIFLTLGVVLFRCRNKISMRCHRYFMYRKYRDDLVFTVENDTAVGELDDGDLRPLKEL